MNNGSPDLPPPTISEDEHEQRLREIRGYLRRMLVMALGRLPEDDLTLLALDQPGLIVGHARSSKRHGAYLVLGVPDEVVVNQTGDVDRRDLIVLVHIPSSAKRVLEGADTARIVLPGGTA